MMIMLFRMKKRKNFHSNKILKRSKKGHQISNESKNSKELISFQLLLGTICHQQTLVKSQLMNRIRCEREILTFKDSTTVL